MIWVNSNGDLVVSGNVVIERAYPTVVSSGVYNVVFGPIVKDEVCGRVLIQPHLRWGGYSPTSANSGYPLYEYKEYPWTSGQWVGLNLICSGMIG